MKQEGNGDDGAVPPKWLRMLLLLLLLLLLLFTHHWPDADLGSRAQVLYKSPCKKKRTSALQVAVQSYPSLRIELNGLHSESQMGRGNELAGREELGEHGGALAREDVALGDVDEVPAIAASGPQEPAHGDAAVAVAAVPGAVDGRDGLAGPDASEVRQSSASVLRFRGGGGTDLLGLLGAEAKQADRPLRLRREWCPPRRLRDSEERPSPPRERWWRLALPRLWCRLLQLLTLPLLLLLRR